MNLRLVSFHLEKWLFFIEVEGPAVMGECKSECKEIYRCGAKLADYIEWHKGRSIQQVIKSMGIYMKGGRVIDSRQTTYHLFL